MPAGKEKETTIFIISGISASKEKRIILLRVSDITKFKTGRKFLTRSSYGGKGTQTFFLSHKQGLVGNKKF